MANLQETAVYEGGVYQLERVDPMIGGEDGAANIQARQLANRTAYLKVRSDDVDASKGVFASLSERMDTVQGMAESVGPEMQNAVTGLAAFAIDQAAQANAGIETLRKTCIQQGTTMFVNRGVIEGCVASKSSTATRNLSLTRGRCFAEGCDWYVGEGVNAASVPSNPGASAIEVFAYLYPDGFYNYSLAVTAAGDEVPENGINLYSIVVPAGNTDQTDPYLANVTLTDLRRVEPDYPILFSDPALAFISFRPLRDVMYHVSLDVFDNTGKRIPADDVIVGVRAINGMVLALFSIRDNLIVQWQVSRLDA